MKRRVDKANEDISLQSYSSKKKKSKSGKRSRVAVTTICIILAVVIAISSFGIIYIKSLLGNIDRAEVTSDIGINSKAEEVYQNYINIALFGLDSRQHNDVGRSDAIMIVSIDKEHNKVKLISIARDSYVDVYRKDGSFKKDKITHAWMNGKQDTAIKTLNANYDMNIKDFVSMNFYQFADVIDYVGGVDIDVSRAEMNVMNGYITELNRAGIKCKYLTKPGFQHLSGGQALAYSRDRYTGSDIERGRRQREVIMALFDQVKDLSVTKYPELIKMFLGKCQTSLTDSEMMSLATWVVTNKPEFDQLGIPTELKTSMIGGVSYVVYDVEKVALQIQDFIHETGQYDPKKVNSSTAVSSVKS